jgi:hypothetical protein
MDDLANSLPAKPPPLVLTAPHQNATEALKRVAVIPSPYYAIKYLWFTAACRYFGLKALDLYAFRMT